MRKITAVLLALILILCLSACKGKSGTGKATPGDLITPTPYVPHISNDAVDVSSEYEDKLCSYPWLDTFDMTYYSLSADGTYQQFIDKGLTETIGSGSWQIVKDDEGYLELHIKNQSGETYDLYELEMYEKSIYAHNAEGTAYIWLLGDPVE